MSGPESNGNEGYSAFPKAPVLQELHNQIVLCLIQDTRFRVGSYPSVELQSIYSAAPADLSLWTKNKEPNVPYHLPIAVLKWIHALPNVFSVTWSSITSSRIWTQGVESTDSGDKLLCYVPSQKIFFFIIGKGRSVMANELISQLWVKQ